MRTPLRMLAILGLALTLAACAAGPTPYLPADPAFPASLGFREAPIEDDRFRVEVAANAATAPETVEDYLLFRAAEITLAQGADWFRIDASGGTPEIRYFAHRYGNRPVRVTPLFARVAVPETAEPGVTAGKKRRYARRCCRHRRHFHRRSRFAFGFGFGFGFFPRYYPGFAVYRPRPVINRLEATAEIRLFTGEKPADDPAAYDARSVIAAIGPRIQRPEQGPEPG
ncbi:MAG: hypothetical protein AAF160_08940 [Pseudomonadota bacterium]